MCIECSGYESEPGPDWYRDLLVGAVGRLRERPADPAIAREAGFLASSALLALGGFLGEW